MHFIFVVFVFYLKITLFILPVSSFDWSATNRLNFLHSYLDLNIDPCVDFYQHACGNFPYKFGFMATIKHDIENRLFQGLTPSLQNGEIVNRFNSLAIQFLVRLLMYCNRRNRGSEKYSILRHLNMILRLTSSLSWPLQQDDLDSLRNTSTTMEMMTEEELGAVHGRFYSKTSKSLLLVIQTHFPMLKIRNTQNEPYFIISLNQDIIDSQYISASRINKMINYAHPFGMPPVTDIDVAIQNLNSFNNYLAKYANKRKKTPEKELFGGKLAQISELNNLTGNTFRWDRFLNAYTAAIGFPELAQFSTQSWIEYRDLRFLRAFAKQLRQSFSPFTIKNFIGWKFYEAIQYLLPNRFEQCYKILGPDENQLIFPWVRLIFEYFYPAEQFRLRPLLADSRNFIDEVLMSSIKWQFERMLNRSKLFGRKSRPILRKKLSAIRVQIAYPDWLFNDTGLDQWYRMDVAIANKPSIRALLDNNPSNALPSFFSVIMEWNEHLLQTFIITIRSKRHSWISSPGLLEANAQYNCLQNRIEVNLGMLFPPLYGPDYPLSLIYGGIGMYLAHEVTHAFDPIGKNFNASGYLKNCLSKRDRHKYNVRCAMLLAINSELRESITGANLNAKLTQMEDIADHGAIRVAFAAMQSYRSKNPRIEGWNRRFSHFNHEQLFFYSWAQTHCEIFQNEEIIYQISSDPHSPSTVRTNELLKNFRPFANAFGCKLNTRMNPERKFLFW